MNTEYAIQFHKLKESCLKTIIKRECGEKEGYCCTIEDFVRIFLPARIYVKFKKIACDAWIVSIKNGKTPQFIVTSQKLVEVSNNFVTKVYDVPPCYITLTLAGFIHMVEARADNACIVKSVYQSGLKKANPMLYFPNKITRPLLDVISFHNNNVYLTDQVPQSAQALDWGIRAVYPFPDNQLDKNYGKIFGRGLNPPTSAQFATPPPLPQPLSYIKKHSCLNCGADVAFVFNVIWQGVCQNCHHLCLSYKQDKRIKFM